MANTSASQTEIMDIRSKELDGCQLKASATVVDFEDDDFENPVNWQSLRKWMIVIAVALLNLSIVLSTAMIIPAAPQALQDLHTTRSLYQTLMVSIWELGEGIGPFYIAPLSERYGRLPVLHVGNLLGVTCCVAAALSVDISMLVAFRFLSGCATVALTLAPAIVGDLFVPEERGKAMAVAISTQVAGGFIAPICGSFIAHVLGWRWVLWINAIIMGAVSLLCVVVVRETYAVKILERKTMRLRMETRNFDLQSKYHVHLDMTAPIELATRPIRMMLFSPTVLLISMYTAVAYSTTYLVLTTLTVIMEQQYSFSTEFVGLAFLGISIGNLIGMFLYGLTSDRYIKYRKAKEGSGYRLENRLIHLILGAALLPIGLLVYGWTLDIRLHYIVPLVASGLIGLCVVIAILPTENYLVDAYPTQSASAIAAGVILRAITGAAFPLCGPPLYQHLGLGWGNSVLALVAAVFLPFLHYLLRHGEDFRRNEKSFASPPSSLAPATRRSVADC